MINKLFSFTKSSAINKRKEEEAFYEFVYKEIEEGKQRKGLWAKALADAKFEENKAKSLYIKLRVQSLIDEKEKKSIEKEQSKKFSNIDIQNIKDVPLEKTIQCKACGFNLSLDSLKPNFLSLLIYSKISRAIFWVSLSNILAMFYNILILSAYTNNILDFFINPFRILGMLGYGDLSYYAYLLPPFLLSIYGYYRAYRAFTLTHKKLSDQNYCSKCGEKIVFR